MLTARKHSWSLSVLSAALLSLCIFNPFGTPATAQSAGADNLGDVAGMLREIAAIETDYFNSAGNYSYGYFEDMLVSGHLRPDVTASNLVNGFSFRWFLNEDKSNYVVVAEPVSSPELIWLAVDSTGTVWSIPMSPVDDESERFVFETATLVETTLDEEGLFDFIDVSPLEYWYEGVELYLSFDRLSYMVRITGTDEHPRNFAWTSVIPDMFCRIVEYDPALGSTNEALIASLEEIRIRSRAMGTMRSLGSTQLAYSSTSMDRTYGTLQDMIDSMYIDESYTSENMTPGYFTIWALNNLKTDFTLVAVPNEGNEHLGTYMVGSDQVVRGLTLTDMISIDSSYYELVQSMESWFEENGTYSWPSELGITVPNGLEVFLSDDMSVFIVRQASVGIDDVFYISDPAGFYSQEQI